MTATQSLTWYNIALKYFKNESDATSFIKEIEIVVDKKFNEKQNTLATKQDISEFRKEISEAKVDIIKWQVGTAIAIVGLLLAIIKLN